METWDEGYLERFGVVIGARVVCKLSCLLHYPLHGWEIRVSDLIAVRSDCRPALFLLRDGMDE